MARRYWLTHLVEANDDQDAQDLLDKQRALDGAKVLDSECRPCVVADDSEDHSHLFAIDPESEPELAPAANFQVELIDDDDEHV